MDMAMTKKTEQPSSWATRQQIQTAITSVPAAQRQVLAKRIQQQQQINLQPLVGNPTYPGQTGYPFAPGTPNYGRPFYPSGPGGYPPGWGPYGYTGGSYARYPVTYSVYATEDEIDDDSFDVNRSGEAQFSDEGADSTETPLYG
jgi:hypothetical protein